MGRLQFGQRQVGQIAALLFRQRHQRARHVMGGAEGQVLGADQPVGWDDCRSAIGEDK